jgi:hypothetical protein
MRNCQHGVAISPQSSKKRRVFQLAPELRFGFTTTLRYQNLGNAMSTVYQELSSEKYWLESVDEEVKMIRQYQRRQSAQTFFTTIAVMFSAGIAFVAAMTSSEWIPMSLDFLRQSNIISM